MFNQVSETIVDTLKTAAIAITGVIGVENADIVTHAVANTVQNSSATPGSPDWIEPLFQGIIAILSIIAAFFRNGKRKKDL